MPLGPLDATEPDRLAAALFSIAIHQVCSSIRWSEARSLLPFYPRRLAEVDDWQPEVSVPEPPSAPTMGPWTLKGPLDHELNCDPMNEPRRERWMTDGGLRAVQRIDASLPIRSNNGSDRETDG